MGLNAAGAPGFGPARFRCSAARVASGSWTAESRRPYRGAEMLPVVEETVPGVMLAPTWGPGPGAQGARALGSLTSPSSPVTLCVCLSRAMVCSQRNTSLSQSPRVGFLSSLLPQSKKSPSRLSPAQGASQALNSAKKEPFSGQVSARPALLTPAKRPLTSDCTFNLRGVKPGVVCSLLRTALSGVLMRS